MKCAHGDGIVDGEPVITAQFRRGRHAQSLPHELHHWRCRAAAANVLVLQIAGLLTSGAAALASLVGLWLGFDCIERSRGSATLWRWLACCWSHSGPGTWRRVVPRVIQGKIDRAETLFPEA